MAFFDILIEYLKLYKKDWLEQLEIMKEKAEPYMTDNDDFKTKFFDKYFDITNRHSDMVSRPIMNKIFEGSELYHEMSKRGI